MPDIDVSDAMEANLASHLAHLPEQLEGAVVFHEADLVLVDSGARSDTFNSISRARLHAGQVEVRIEWALRHFRSRELPFSWWVGPTSRPDDLAERLTEHRLSYAETESGMWLDLGHAPSPPPTPPELDIRVVVSEDDLAAYAAVLAANWDPPDRAVTDVYARAASGTLDRSSPARYYIGYLDGNPVATSECYLAHGVAGIYNVATLAHARRRGFGTAMTAVALQAARAEGYGMAVLQASDDGTGIYERLGFTVRGEFREYKP